jgi:hypothetical protein
MKMEHTQCPEMLEFKLQTLGNNPEESIPKAKHVRELSAEKDIAA